MAGFKVTTEGANFRLTTLVVCLTQMIVYPHSKSVDLISGKL
jgi:hypothetical protein